METNNRKKSKKRNKGVSSQLRQGRIPCAEKSYNRGRKSLNNDGTSNGENGCEENGLLRRSRSGNDRRQVTLSVTPEGDALLRKLGAAARQELRETGPMLVDSILRLTEDGAAPKSKAGGTRKSGP